MTRRSPRRCLSSHPARGARNLEAHDASTPSFRSTLLAALAKFPQCSAHIKQWLNSADDPVWKEIVSVIVGRCKYGKPEEHFAANYQWIVNMGLVGKVDAEEAGKTGRDTSREFAQSQKAHHLKLAESAEYLAKEYATNSSTRFQQLARLLQSEATNFHEIAAQWHTEPTMHVSRQAAGIKRARFRVHAAFMSRIIRSMRRTFGKPHYKVVIIMTNAAFPEADVTEEDARSVWKAMAGLRRRNPITVHSTTD
jgi:hypothetical protein